MRVDELRLIMKGLPDNMLVCGIGHYGEALEVYDARMRTVKIGGWTGLRTEKALALDIEDAGPEPD